MAIKKGDKIQVDYEGKLDDGLIFDSSEKHNQPLEFEVGGGQVIPGFDDAVIGLEVGDEKEFKIDAENAYGQRNDQLIQKVPKAQLPQDQEPQVGMMLGVGMPNGQQLPATITEVGAEDITLDLNHPLAGKNLTFKIKVVKIN